MSMFNYAMDTQALLVERTENPPKIGRLSSALHNVGFGRAYRNTRGVRTSIPNHDDVSISTSIQIIENPNS
jgi:hypothetical protein